MIKINISPDEYEQILEGFSNDFKGKYNIGSKERDKLQHTLNQASYYDIIEAKP